MYRIREACPADYAAMAEINSLIRPEPISGEEMLESDNRSHKEGILTRLVAEDEQGRVAGYGFAERMPWLPDGRWEVYACSHPTLRGRGVGSAVYEAVERLAREGGATSLNAWCRSNDDGALAFAEHRGFGSALVRTEAVLDLSSWGGSRFAGHLERVRAGGIRLETFTGATPDPIVRGLYDVERLTVTDVPEWEEGSNFPAWEDYRRMWHDYTEPRFAAVALDGDRAVALSTLYYNTRPGRAGYTGYTGVLREYRGRGLALAVKLLCIAHAVEKAIPRMRTNNDFANPPMLAVNEKLGYRLVPGPRRLLKGRV